MKHVISLLCAVVLGGCGAEDLSPRSPEARALELAEFPGTHGYEIILPIAEQSGLPPEWRWEDTEIGSFVYLQSPGVSEGVMDWHGGNALYNVSSPSRPPLIRTHIAPGEGHAVIGHITGFFTNTQPGMVRGSVELAPEQDSQLEQVRDFVELALQTDGGPGVGWQDVATQRVYAPEYGLKFAELQATVVPNVPVRFEIRAWRSSFWHRYVYITRARLFGAQCYPDFSKPSGCL